MYVLFLFIHLVFAAVFYFFNRIPESAAFVILGAAFFFAFGPFDFKKKPPSDAENGIGASKIASEAKGQAIRFLKSGTYYLGFSLFYLSLYGIAYSLAPSLAMASSSVYGWLTMALSVCSAILFFAFGPKHDVASKIFRSNAFVFSAVHFSLLAYRCFSGVPLDPTFIANVVLSLASFWTVVLFGSYSEPRERNAAYLFFLVYAYAASVALFIRAFGVDEIHALLSVLFLEAVAVFDGLTRIRKLREYRSVGAFAGAVFSYVCVLSVFAYAFWKGIDAFILVYAFFVSAFQAYLHAKYENYLSVTSVLAVSAFLYFQAFFPGPASGFFPYVAFSFGFPLAIVTVAKWKTFHAYDRHFLFASAILFAFWSFFGYFVRFSAYSILEVSLLSLGFSILFFVSYLGLRK